MPPRTVRRSSGAHFATICFWGILVLFLLVLVYIAFLAFTGYNGTLSILPVPESSGTLLAVWAIAIVAACTTRRHPR